MNTRAASGEETSAPGAERRAWGPDPRAAYPEGNVALERAGPAPPGPFAALERRLLLARESGEDSIPRLARSSRARAAGLAVALAILCGAGILFFVQVRGHWKARAGFLEGELEAARSAAARREDVHQRQAAEKERAIEERRSENQSLAALAGKTLEELRTALDDLRKAREENSGLEKELREALRARAPSLGDTVREWLSLARPAPASGPAVEPDAPPSEQERAGGEDR